MHNIRAKTCTNNNKTELVIIKGGHTRTKRLDLENVLIRSSEQCSVDFSRLFDS